jgi:hypothetical protein
MQQIIALEDEITPETYEKLRQLVKKMDQLLTGSGLMMSGAAIFSHKS